jgi:chromosome segregation ATPase
MSSTPPPAEDIPSLKTQIAGLEAALLSASNKLRDCNEENRVLNESVKSLNKVVEELRTQIHHTPNATPVSTPAPAPVATAEENGASSGNSELQMELEELRRKNGELASQLETQQTQMQERADAWNAERHAMQEKVTRLEDQVIVLSERIPPDGSGGATPPPLTASAGEPPAPSATHNPQDATGHEEIRRLSEQVETLTKELQLKQEDFSSEGNRWTETLEDRDRSIHRLEEQLEGYRSRLEQEREIQTELRNSMNDLSSKVSELEASNTNDRLRFAEELQKMIVLSSVVREVSGSHNQQEDDRVTLEEVRTVLLTDAEQQLLARDNTTLGEENAALRQMLDGLLKEFEAVTEGTKSLRQQVLVLHQQLKDERQLRDSLVRDKSMELESHYAQVLIKKQDELESLGTRLALAEKTIASILPTEQHSAPPQRNLFGGTHGERPFSTPAYGSAASPIPNRAWESSPRNVRNVTSTQSASPSLLRSMMADV